MNDLDIRLSRIEKMLSQVLEGMKNSKTVEEIKSKWLTESQVRDILNLTKRGMEDLRQKQILRSSSATGRNFKYYRADVESYLYDHSAVKKRTATKNF